MTTQNHPTQVIKRSFILHKVPPIDLQNNMKFKQAIDSIFRNPNTYFSNHFNDREIVVGKKTDILPITNCLSGSFSVPNKQLSRQNNYQSLISQGKTARRTNSNKNLLLNTSSRSTKQNVSNSKELPSNQRFIDDIELKKMFEDFRSLQKKNIKMNKSSSVHNILIDNAKGSVKTNMEHILNSQEKSLTLYKKITQQSKRLIDKLSKKVNKNPRDLNINHIRNYRMKKEIKNDLQEEVNIQNDIFNNFEWELNLRKDPNVRDKKFINYGGVKYPNWYPVVMNPKKHKEIIRSPKEGDKGKINLREQKEVDLILEDIYLKERVNNKTLQDYKLSPRASLLDDLHVTGKDLLLFEQENCKLIKGKKILVINNEKKNGQNLRNIVISRNFSLPVLKKFRTFSE